ncbi:MAG: hypothetical protein Q9M23_06690, partial [Mariprofundaceae bacterium]|nr:hypothetical protein [Mariprofundaceae bacterium]
FLISDIVVNSLYQKLGLYNGDIIRRINGTPLLRANQADDLYRALSNPQAIELEIMRAGQVKQLGYRAQ